MKASEIVKYLSRIKLDDCTNDLIGLTKLQEHHMENIPFENLDVVVGRKITLGHDHLFEKIILKKRGGYCFELNTLYAELLVSLGFVPKPVLGRVWLSNPKRMPPRTHLANLVDVEGKTYVTDVGFGGLITRVPLDINVSFSINDKDGVVRVVPVSEYGFMIQRQVNKSWENQYSFEKTDVGEEDIYISNYYMSTNPRSHFFYHKFVGMNTEDGRIGLFNNKISTRKGIKVVDKSRVDFGEDWLTTIKDKFLLELDFSDEEFDILFKNHLAVEESSNS